MTVVGAEVSAGEIGLQVEHWDTAADGELSEAALRRKLERRGYRVARCAAFRRGDRRYAGGESGCDQGVERCG